MNMNSRPPAIYLQTYTNNDAEGTQDHQQELQWYICRRTSTARCMQLLRINFLVDTKGTFVAVQRLFYRTRARVFRFSIHIIAIDKAKKLFCIKKSNLFLPSSDFRVFAFFCDADARFCLSLWKAEDGHNSIRINMLVTYMSIKYTNRCCVY